VKEYSVCITQCTAFLRTYEVRELAVDELAQEAGDARLVLRAARLLGPAEAQTAVRATAGGCHYVRASVRSGAGTGASGG